MLNPGNNLSIRDQREGGGQVHGVGRGFFDRSLTAVKLRSKKPLPTPSSLHA